MFLSCVSNEILINSFKIGKSVGPYSIPIKLLEVLCFYISQPFSQLVNKSYCVGNGHSLFV